MFSLNNIKGFIFDLDGTLLDSMSLWHEVDRKYLAQYGIEYILKYSNDIKGLTFDETAQYFIKNFNIPLSAETIKAQWNAMVEEEYKNYIQCKNGVPAFIKYLKSNGIKMCVATSCNKKHATMALERLGLLSYFDFIRTCDEVGKNKEYPDIYEQCASMLSLKNEDCVVVEDLYNALKVANNVGFKTMCIYEEHHAHEIQCIQEMVNWYIYSFKDLL